MTAAAPRRSPVSFLHLSLLSAVILAITAGFLLWSPGAGRRVVASDVIAPVVEVLAAASLFLAAWFHRTHSKRQAWAWGTLGLAMLFYALGDTTWAMLELVLKETPFPSAADGFYISYDLAALAGVILLISRPFGRGQQLKGALDLGTVLAVASLLFWNFLVGPTLQSNASAPPLQQAILMAYPVGDLVLLGALLLLVYSESEAHDPLGLWLLGSGFALTILGDVFYSYQALRGTYASGGLLDLSWIAANLLIGLAGAVQWSARPAPDRAAPVQLRPGSREALVNVRTYLPYLWIAGALSLLIWRSLDPLPMSYLAISVSVAVIIGLVLARQAVTLFENRRLNTQLRLEHGKLLEANRDLTEEIGERHRLAERLSHDALYDGLTGLANRTMFVDHLSQAIEQSKRNPEQSFAVFFMDLDQFKVVNDSLGHSYGDQLLVGLGKRLMDTVRAIDTVARLGGDEFGFLFPDVKDEASARGLAEKIQAALRPPFHLGGRAVHITASIGIAMDANKYDRPQDFLRDADLAMYQAKALGKAHAEVFASAMRTQANARLQIEEELRQGLERREFRVYYQPINSLKSNEIVGFESLLRWLHPVRALLMPADFLQIAEESALIVPLGQWALEEACAQLKRWQRQHAHLKEATIGVNLSMQQFSQPHLAADIAKALGASGLEGRYLRLEIAERALVGRDAMSDRVINALSELGVQLQVDDFWTGSSALAYLQHFPVQALKMDRSFVRRMMEDRKGLGFVRAVVGMASDMGIDSVAEGIETTEQLEELRALSCGFGQGFLLAAPMDAASLEPILAARQPLNRGEGGSSSSAADEITRPHRPG